MDEVKTLDGWFEKVRENEGCQYSWTDYASPGDFIDRQAYSYFLTVVPRKYYQAGVLQVGEPYSRRFNEDIGNLADTFLTFQKINPDTFVYCGMCFIGQNENQED